MWTWLGSDTIRKDRVSWRECLGLQGRAAGWLRVPGTAGRCPTLATTPAGSATGSTAPRLLPALSAGPRTRNAGRSDAHPVDPRTPAPASLRPPHGIRPPVQIVQQGRAWEAIERTHVQLAVGSLYARLQPTMVPLLAPRQPLNGCCSPYVATTALRASRMVTSILKSPAAGPGLELP